MIKLFYNHVQMEFDSFIFKANPLKCISMIWLT